MAERFEIKTMMKNESNNLHSSNLVGNNLSMGCMMSANKHFNTPFEIRGEAVENIARTMSTPFMLHRGQNMDLQQVPTDWNGIRNNNDGTFGKGVNATNSHFDCSFKHPDWSSNNTDIGQSDLLATNTSTSKFGTYFSNVHSMDIDHSVDGRQGDFDDCGSRDVNAKFKATTTDNVRMTAANLLSNAPMQLDNDYIEYATNNHNEHASNQVFMDLQQQPNWLMANGQVNAGKIFAKLNTMK